MLKGSRTPGNSYRPRGLCPVCLTGQVLSAATGKIGRHGWTRDNMSGCAGKGQRPVKLGPDGKAVPGGSRVVGMQAGESGPSARHAAPEPADRSEP